MAFPFLHSALDYTDWTNIYPEDRIETVDSKVDFLLSQTSQSPWNGIGRVCAEAAQLVIDKLQSKLHDESTNPALRTTCIKCLREMRKHHNVIPSSFLLSDVKLRHSQPVTKDGGHADIYQGTITGPYKVCLKVPRMFTNDGPSEERRKLQAFGTEALIWGQLSHPNILPFLGFNNTLFPRTLCLVSPWMSNGHIMSFLKQHPEHDRLKAIALGMRYMHETDPQVVHGDLKGANILVDKDSNCRIADFGLSHFRQTITPASSELAEKGTSRWLAPEILDYRQRFKNPTVAARDVYAFACTTIEIYTGKPPYSDLPTDGAVLVAVLVENRPPLRPSVEELPSDELWALVTSCLSTDPEKRPRAREIIQALGNISNWAFPVNEQVNECPYDIDDSPVTPEGSDEEYYSQKRNIEKRPKSKPPTCDNCREAHKDCKFLKDPTTCKRCYDLGKVCLTDGRRKPLKSKSKALERSKRQADRRATEKAARRADSSRQILFDDFELD